MDLSAEEAQTKKLMSDACNRVYALFDSAKLTGFGLHSFTNTDRITGLFTDDAADAQELVRWKELDVPLTAVPVHTAGDDRQRPRRTHTTTAPRSRHP